ncbi:MAG: HAMP domain-containing histidine kinase [Lachnospiraceae bacterium]|nr:HAMP domain-containing histidine kinase [Lachnospiraceae bacterium]
MDDIKSLKRFLITRFIQILIVTAVVEAVLLYLIRNTVIAWTLGYFFGTPKVSEIGFTRLSLAFIVILFQIIAELVRIILPSGAASSIDFIVKKLGNALSGLFALPEGTVQITEMSLTARVVLWLIMLFSVVMIALPCAVAAFVYARIVIREFRSIENAETARIKEYEKKRNLMLSDIAHDLRTPMTTISGYAKALDDDLITEDKRKEIYSSIQNKAKRMNDLIGLLFDYVKLDSEGFSLNKEETDICELTRECAAFLYQDIEDAGMELDIDVPEKAIMINADRLQFTRVINNLMTNAIRHNEPGNSIGVYLVCETDRINIMICDSGAVIPEERAEHIFEPFVMGDESRNSKGGSGLGLSIASKIITMHGYRLRLIQKPNILTYKQAAGYSKMFMITIPLQY